MGRYFCQGWRERVWSNMLWAALRIHDILVWMRIRIRGSMLQRLVEPDANPDPSIFIIDLQDANKNNFCCFSAYYFLKVLLHHFSQIKSQKEVTKQKK
jgi:hypothetical protein